jgi:excisionase family DNA binding protein
MSTTTNVPTTAPAAAATATRDGSAPSPTLTVAEAATLLGVSRWLVQQQVGKGVLPAVRLGRRILIPRARLLAWLESRP